MIEKNHPSLSDGTQCRLLSRSRSSFYGAQQMTWHLQNGGLVVN
jgi:hypothetical protein